MAKLKEITMTLFNNKPGYTLSVTPNYNYGGKRINFSFKGNNTLSLKAIKDLTTAQEPVASMIREMTERDRFRQIYQDRNTYDIVRFSKGYLSTGRGSKGPTVPAVGILMRASNTWAAYLDFYHYDYVADDLCDDVLTDSQIRGGAVAGHRWREPTGEVIENVFDFLGDTDE